MRFREMEQNCGYGLNSRQWNSVIFIPKRDILFLGFGMYVTFKKDDIKLKIQWRLGKDGVDYQSEEHDIDLIHENHEPDTYYHTIDIQDLDYEPLRVSEGTHIYILAKPTDTT